jgi:hypothetical protein
LAKNQHKNNKKEIKMATINQKLNSLLQENGLWPKDAENVLELFKKEDNIKSLNIHWNDDTSGYPTVFLSSIWYALRRFTLSWIEKNQPDAWYKQIFAE